MGGCCGVSYDAPGGGWNAYDKVEDNIKEEVGDFVSQPLVSIYDLNKLISFNAKICILFALLDCR